MNHYTGTAVLLRLALRRDRLILGVWIALLGLVPAGSVPAYEQLYPTQAGREAFAASTAANPSLNVLYGEPFELATPGGFLAYRYAGTLAVLIALMCVFTVTRHTRAEEESGRLELLGSGVLGRRAPLTAAVLVAGGASLLTGAVMAIGLIGTGLPAAGSVAFGLGLGLIGLVLTGVAALAAQLTEYPRTCNGIACGAIGMAFLLRAAGDSATDLRWLSWLSPIGWVQQARAFAGERWWVYALLAGAAVVFVLAAALLQPRRDCGAALFAARPGPAHGAAGLRSSVALAWRMHRGALFGWVIAIAVFGAVFGSMANGIADLVSSSEQTRAVFERLGGSRRMVDGFLAALAGIYGLTVAVYATVAALRTRTEEVAHRVEPLLATGVSRGGWLAAHLVFALFGPAVLLAVGGLATGLAHGIAIGDPAGQVPAMLAATLAQLPACWVVVGVVSVLFAVVPRLVTAAWAVLSGCVLITLFGQVLGLDAAVLDVSPFSHIPKLPAAEATAAPLVWLTGIAVLALCVGAVGFRRRDIG